LAGQQKILENQNGTTRKDDQSTIQTNGHGRIDSSSSKIQTAKDGPIEEPWLIEPIVLKLSSLLAEQTKINEEQTDAVVVPPQKEVDAGSTVILVNSSACTMQRIAILEGGKLAELLLEPVQNEVRVKNNAQVDSIYLGVITDLVPHMRGAFVDIGIKKPSLMAISPHRKPFVYPTAEKEEDREEEIGEDIEVGDADVVDYMLDPLLAGINRIKRNQWVSVKEGTKIIVQVVKEQLHRKGPSLTPYPNLRSRFWVSNTSLADIFSFQKRVIYFHCGAHMLWLMSLRITIMLKKKRME
jgi:hypothetical protein